MSKLTVDECKRIIIQGRKQLTVAEQRIAELEAECATHGTLTAEQVREAWTGNLKRDCLYDPPMPDWQAIADELNAELGSERHAYEQRITGDGSDWGEIMRGAYDDLMASACESCTPEQMGQLADYIRGELGSGLNPDGLPSGLTISDDSTLLNWRGENYVKQSTLGGGVCENVSDPPSGFLCSECGWGDFCKPSHLLTTAKFTDNDRGPNYCPNCGACVKAVGR